MDSLRRQRTPGSGITIVMMPDMTVGRLLAEIDASTTPSAPKVKDVPPAYRQLEARGRRHWR